MNSTVQREAPEISILIPVYNAEKTLGRALDSALGQSLKKIEIVAVNDGSPDACGAILKARAATDPRLKIVTLAENSGTLTARRRALEAAKGKYILSLDPDDALTAYCAETTLCAAEQTGADIVHFDLIEFVTRPDGTEKQVWNWSPAKHGFLSGKNAVLADLLKSHGHPWNLCLKLIRRDLFLEAVKDLPEFRCVMGEDLLLYAAVACRAGSILKLDRTLYRYYMEENSITKRGFRTCESFRPLLGELRALDLCESLMPDDSFRMEMQKIRLRQCRKLVTRCRRDLSVEDQKKMYVEMGHCGYASQALAQAFQMSLLNPEEDFLAGKNGVWKLFNLFFPRGSRRRVFLKTAVKRILGKG